MAQSHPDKGGVAILSDTRGIDFGPYLKKILPIARTRWLPLIPEEARPPRNVGGITGIRFSILPNGKVAPGSMHLDYSTHNDAINRAAWGAIIGVGQFPPLPKAFTGPNLELRIEFRINMDVNGTTPNAMPKPDGDLALPDIDPLEPPHANGFLPR